MNYILAYTILCIGHEVMTVARQGLKVTVICQGQSHKVNANMCVYTIQLQVSTAVSYDYLFM